MAGAASRIGRLIAPPCALLVALALMLALGGCAVAPETGADRAGSDGSSAADDNAVPAPSGDQQPPAGTGGGDLLVLGRSVMTGWMAHWGGDASTPVEWNGYEVTFREVEGPPGIASSATSAIASAVPGTTVLYKYCFVDFNGGEYDAELAAYLDDVESVADAAAARGVRLVVGTALPKVRAETTPELVAEHREFGRRLEELAGARRAGGQDVLVLDLHRVLADSGGALRSEFAVSADDSHLTEAAYDALDDALLALLAPPR